MTYYSQFGQDVWLINHAFKGKRNGFFIEAGSYDGISFSNTLALEKYYGWVGLLIEANPNLYMHSAKNRPICACINACLWDDNNIDLQFMLADDALMCGVKDTIDNDIESTSPNIITMRSVTLDSIWNNFGHPHVDLLSLDLEGAELKALHGCSSMLRNDPPHILLVEHNAQAPFESRNIHAKDDIAKFLSGFGYKIANEFCIEDAFMHE